MPEPNWLLEMEGFVRRIENDVLVACVIDEFGNTIEADIPIKLIEEKDRESVFAGVIFVMTFSGDEREGVKIVFNKAIERCFGKPVELIFEE